MAALPSVIAAENLQALDASQLREMVVRLKAEVLHKQTSSTSSRTRTRFPSA